MLSDFRAAIDQIRLFIDGGRVDWQAARYIVSEVIYGGRITDDKDRRLCHVLTSKFLRDDVLKEGHVFCE